MELFQSLIDVRKSHLLAAFDTMKLKYGSIDGVIQKGLGVNPAERTKLQARYLEYVKYVHSEGGLW
ncbi:tyrosine-protein phosphatase [Paenibacillus alvei]|uniref:Uncharacterized protein n=1 Tax=Paenibacillus alvei TaxID=44250 RepID=A0A383RG68_PAEAL|nr:tyrosine-protein phosphatase [Paenibacillus alvei]SYX86097.1 protein of unknown function [Paenibacillus alvei]